MKICLLVEGSYPYVVGGVSSWIQMLITGLPMHQFIIYSIGAEEKTRGQFKYKLPDNVIAVHELFLDSILNLKSPTAARYALSAAEKENLERLICGVGDINLSQLLATFRVEDKKRDPLEIFMSFDFFDVITNAYRKKYNHLPFTDFFWTIRSMLLPLFYLLQQDLPVADIYHSVATGYCGVVGGLASSVYKKPFILTEHGIYSREREEEIIKCDWAKGEFKSVWIQYFYSLSRLAYQNAVKVITLFEKNAEIEVALGCDRDKIEIIPNGIHVERFLSIAPPAPRPQEIVVAAVIRVVPVKDIITMLRSFALVKKQLSYAKFLIMGPCDEDPEYYEACVKTVETLQIEDLEFTGSVDIKAYLGKTDILILSSISEGQPLAVLEGMASRRPFVTTDVGCCREVLYGGQGDEMGRAGIVVPIMDFEGMAEAIVDLALHEEKRLRMGEIGCRRACAAYTFEKFIAAYYRVYDEEYRRQEVE